VVPLDFFGRGRKRGGKGPRGGGDPDYERTPEEEALAARAREEAARRATERLGQAEEVSDLLGGMLEVDESGGEKPGPAPGRKPSIPPDAAAARAAGSTARKIPTFKPEERGERRPGKPGGAGAAGREPVHPLSPELRPVMDGLMELGRSDSDAAPDFAEGSAAGEPAGAPAPERRRRTPRLAFEPDESVGLDVESPSVPKTEIFTSPPVEAPRPADVTSRTEAFQPAGPAPSGDAAPQAKAVPPEEDVEADDSTRILASAAVKRGTSSRRLYSLDDLPDAGIPAEEDDLAEEVPPVDGEETLAEVELPWAGLLDVPDEEETEESPASDDAELDRLLVAAGVEPEEEGRPPSPELPAPEDLEPAITTEISGAAATSSDLLAEQTMPDFEIPTETDEEPGERAPEVPPAPEPLEERAAEEVPIPLEETAPPAEQQPVPAGEAEEGLVESLGGAERAADLSVGQLAAVEKLIEEDVGAEEEASAALAVDLYPEAPGIGPLSRLLSAARGGAAALVSLRAAADRALKPYSLSCRLLLGIAGILMLCVAGALSIKTWIFKGY
jgi:hypothetical protein